MSLQNNNHNNNNHSDDPVPYSLRYPEELATCSLVTQAVIGHEDRLVSVHT